jgi:DNA-binding IclR family transcriptional regulator
MTERGAVATELASVGRTLAVLEALAAEREGLSVTELATGLGLSKTNVFRVLASLKSLGYVHQDERSARYALTFKLPALSYRYIDAHRLDDICMPILQRLADETNELARLALAQGDELRWVAQAEGSHRRIRLTAELGQPVVLHASATGKAWLASLPDEEALRIVLAHGMEARTEHTITSVDALLAEVRRVREQGYATAIEEGDNGVLAVAVAIREKEGRRGAPGTLSIAGTVLNVDRERLLSFVPLLQDAADQLSAWASMEYFPLDQRVPDRRRPTDAAAERRRAAD